MKNKVLIVHANPRSNKTSHSWKIAQILNNKFHGIQNIEIIDLYRSEGFPLIDDQFFNSTMFPLDGYYKDEKKQKLKIDIARQFANATEVIIVAPFWTGLFPSFLKNWIDLLAEKDITLTMNSKETISGIFRGKVKLIQTCGGLSKDNARNYGAKLIEDNMKFYGATKFDSILIEEIDKVTEGNLIKIIEKFCFNQEN